MIPFEKSFLGLSTIFKVRESHYVQRCVVVAVLIMYRSHTLTHSLSLTHTQVHGSCFPRVLVSDYASPVTLAHDYDTIYHC